MRVDFKYETGTFVYLRTDDLRRGWQVREAHALPGGSRRYVILFGTQRVEAYEEELTIERPLTLPRPGHEG